MNLFINSPSYYTQKHGVVDEVYTLCNAISKAIDVQKYTALLDTIGITPIIAPSTELENNCRRETKLVSLPYRMASISLISDYDRFSEATISEKQQIIIDNILRSLYVVKKKLRDDFDFDRLKADIEAIVDNQTA